MRWIQWDDSQSRWCKPHRIIGPIADQMRTVCGQWASLTPRGTLDGQIYDPTIEKYRLRAPEERVWRRETKERNGQVTITYTDPAYNTVRSRERIRMGEVNTVGPGLCRICNWTSPDDEIELRRWQAKHIDGIMASER